MTQHYHHHGIGESLVAMVVCGVTGLLPHHPELADSPRSVCHTLLLRMRNPLLDTILRQIMVPLFENIVQLLSSGLLFSRHNDVYTEL